MNTSRGSRNRERRETRRRQRKPHPLAPPPNLPPRQLLTHLIILCAIECPCLCGSFISVRKLTFQHWWVKTAFVRPQYHSYHNLLLSEQVTCTAHYICGLLCVYWFSLAKMVAHMYVKNGEVAIGWHNN